MPPIFRPKGWRPREVTAREADQRRGSARERGYDARWDRASASHRRKHPLCEYCLTGAFGQAKRSTACTLTDHLYPHRQYDGVFWVKDWWVSSCDDCHSIFKQALERKGRAALDALARFLGRKTYNEGLPS